MSAFPPHRSTESIPVSQEIALKYLSTYLLQTKSSPHLLPNARLEPSGPTSGSSNSSIVIHNLQRVEAGLRGEWLAPTLELEERKGVVVAEGMDDGTNKQKDGVEGEEEGWMDLDQYQREQSIEGGEIGSSGANFVAQEGDSDLEVENTKGGDDEDEEGIPAPKKINTKHHSAPKEVNGTLKDKEARKRAKKDRQKAEKIAKEKARLAAKNN